MLGRAGQGSEGSRILLAKQLDMTNTQYQSMASPSKYLYSSIPVSSNVSDYSEPIISTMCQTLCKMF